MDKPLSINDGLITPSPLIEINAILETQNPMPSLNALLCMDILKYATEKKGNDAFRFEDLARWLLSRNDEFFNFYKGTKKHVTWSARIANRRQRIQRHIDNLVQLGLLEEKSTTKAKKNRVDIPTYDFTLAGYLLAWLIKNTVDSARHLSDIVNSCKEFNDSCSLVLVTNFFRKCNQRGIFTYIISFFMSNILPRSLVTHGRDLLLLFLGIPNVLNWLSAAPEIFIETLKELDTETKKIMLFNCKMEVEEYYNQNYLKQSLPIAELNMKAARRAKIDIDTDRSYSSIITVPGKEWQMARFNNAQDYSRVAVPGSCDRCKSESSFLVDIFRYFDCIIAANRPYPSKLVSGNCTKCGNYPACGDVMSFQHFTSGWT
jgi:hypothetical protein